MELEDILASEDSEELKKLKIWLFKESIRLAESKKELDAQRRKLSEDEKLFDRKLEILQSGFKALEEDRKRVEREKKLLSYEKARIYDDETTDLCEEAVEILFRNLDNPLALRKRYKDLVKIYHPDNLFGDPELMQKINKEFQKKKKQEY